MITANKLTTCSSYIINLDSKPKSSSQDSIHHTSIRSPVHLKMRLSFAFAINDPDSFFGKRNLWIISNILYHLSAQVTALIGQCTEFPPKFYIRKGLELEPSTEVTCSSTAKVHSYDSIFDFFNITDICSLREPEDCVSQQVMG